MGVADGVGGVKGRRRRGEGADSPSYCRSGRCEASGEGTGLSPFLCPIKKRGDKSGSVALFGAAQAVRESVRASALGKKSAFLYPDAPRTLSWQEIGIPVARNPFRNPETLQESGFLAKMRISRRIGATETRFSCHESAILACRIQESRFLARFGLHAPRILAKLASPKSALGYSVGCASSTMRMRSCWLCTSHLR